MDCLKGQSGTVRALRLGYFRTHETLGGGERREENSPPRGLVMKLSRHNILKESRVLKRL